MKNVRRSSSIPTYTLHDKAMRHEWHLLESAKCFNM